ncbi:MAG TPA: hypothetical protein VE010_22810 [Thermoanaerobaculia bacterium]|nr:hypothetical protein [Thermoanaerobaculia bacterium]
MLRSIRVGLVLLIALAAGVFFFAWHSPLLSQAGRVRGFDSDAAIIGLMGRKLLEGRGFDVFFWGQNYLGPLTSMFAAATGAFTGGVGPLALRLGTMLEIFAGILLMGWGVARIDRRAGLATIVVLVVTPPVLVQMIVVPLGAEMAFFMSAVLFAAFVHRPHPLLLGVLAGIGWWMNQQIVFTLMAGAAVLAFRSPTARGALRHLRIRDRWHFRGGELGWRRVPGVVHAAAWVMTRTGALLFVAFIALDVAGVRIVPFVFGRSIEALLRLMVPLVLMPLAFGEWRHWRFPVPAELAPTAVFACGFVVGYAPVWLGWMLGWFERTYVFSFRLNYPSEIVTQLRSFRAVAAHWTGAPANTFVALLFFLAFGALIVAALRTKRTDARVLLALVPLLNIAFYLVAAGTKPHYVTASVGMLFGLAAVGLVELYERRRVAAAICAFIVIASLAASTRRMHHQVLSEPDPLPLLARVRSAQCAVTYADFWIAYRYRLLDEERGAWIPYRSHNRTKNESIAAQRLPGQRCLVDNDGTVVKLDRDLPLVHTPPRRGAGVNPPARPSA